MPRPRVICGATASNVHPPRLARYRWYTHEGRYHQDLCAHCCGVWLMGALEDEGLMPHRVDLLW